MDVGFLIWDYLLVPGPHFCNREDDLEAPESCHIFKTIKIFLALHSWKRNDFLSHLYRLQNPLRQIVIGDWGLNKYKICWLAFWTFLIYCLISSVYLCSVLISLNKASQIPIHFSCSWPCVYCRLGDTDEPKAKCWLWLRLYQCLGSKNIHHSRVSLWKSENRGIICL